MRLDYSKPVKVYRNLKHGRRARPLWSVMQNGRVVRRTHRILLSNVKFTVNESGRQRVLKTGRKNVHAFAVGYVVESAMGIDRNSPYLPIRISYNPYDGPTFVTAIKSLRDFTPQRKVKGALAVLLNERGITAAYLS